MHECPECGQACCCDGEDTWNSFASYDCFHECMDDMDDDDAVDEEYWEWFYADESDADRHGEKHG